MDEKIIEVLFLRAQPRIILDVKYEFILCRGTLHVPCIFKVIKIFTFLFNIISEYNLFGHMQCAPTKNWKYYKFRPYI